MRKLAIILITALVLIFSALLAAPFLIPMETYKKEATDRLTLMLGRKIAINGPLRLKLFPNVAVEVHDLVIGNPPGFSETPFATVGSFAAQMPLDALLNRQIIITSVNIKKPVVALEVNKKGKNNWQFEIQEPKTAAVDAPSFALISPANAATPAFAPQSIALKRIEISDGVISTINAISGARQSISDLALTAKADSFSEPMEAKASMVWNGEKVNIEHHAASMRAMFLGDATQVKTRVDSSLVKLTFDGETSANLTKGKLEVGTPSLAAAAKWLGNDFSYRKAALVAAAKGDLSYAQNQMKLDNAEIALDNIRLKGNVKASFAGEKPLIVAQLVGDALDLNPYANSLPHRGRGGVGAGLLSAASSEQDSPPPNLPLAGGGIGSWFISEAYAAAPWATTPISLNALRAFDADVSLKAGSVKLKAWDLKNVNLRTTVQAGQLALNVGNLETFGGAMTGIIRASGQGERPSVGITMKGSGVQVEPLLKAVAKNDRITGTGEFTIDVTASGTTQAEMMQSLDGSGSIAVKNGKIKGVDLAQMARNIKGAFSEQAAGGAQETDFTELGGSYTIKSGVLTNQDLAMKAPYVRLAGKGQVNLAAYTINYRLVPELVDTGTGQGGKDKSGIAVPILVTGPLDNPSFMPDMNSIVQDAMKNPEKFKENVKNVQKLLKENKGDIKQQLKDAKQLLKGGDLGGLLGGIKKPEAVPAPTAPVAPAVVPAISIPATDTNN